MCQNKPKEAKCMPKQSQNDLLSGYSSTSSGCISSYSSIYSSYSSTSSGCISIYSSTSSSGSIYSTL